MPAWGTQRGWRRCAKCQALWFGAHSEISVCPGGGRHSPAGDSNYSLIHSAVPLPAGHQENWCICDQCQNLWFAGKADESRCSSGGRHTRTNSANFALATGAGLGQAGWRRCSKCQTLWFSLGGVSKCPAGGNHRAAGEFHLPLVTRTLKVHTKTVVIPRVPIPVMFQAMRVIYAACGIDVEWASDEVLNLPHLEVLEVGNGCKKLRDLSAEQTELFSHRQVAGDELVVYFVDTTIPVLNGCAAHPEGRPAAVIASIATEWTLAHEIGHVLGLRHAPDTDSLMTGAGTASVTNPPPDLSTPEVDLLTASALVATA